jgi:hypothetical protein
VSPCYQRLLVELRLDDLTVSSRSRPFMIRYFNFDGCRVLSLYVQSVRSASENVA